MRPALLFSIVAISCLLLNSLQVEAEADSGKRKTARFGKRKAARFGKRNVGRIGKRNVARIGKRDCGQQESCDFANWCDENGIGSDQCDNARTCCETNMGCSCDSVN